jgi:hypothetical protein
MSPTQRLIFDAITATTPCPDSPGPHACPSCLAVAVEFALENGAPQ